MTTLRSSDSAADSPTDGTDSPLRSHRLPALDVLRGLAILGTLLTNIWIFSSATGTIGAAALGSVGTEAHGERVESSGPLEVFVDSTIQIVTDGKWIGLLTIMFGIGLEIQRQSALRRGETWPGTYPWRALVLILEGTLNYIFIFEFDVLMGYGLTALVVCAVLATNPRAQKIWLTVGLSLHLLVILSGSVLQTQWFFELVTGESMAEDLSAAEREWEASPERSEGGSMMPTDSYWAQVAFRLTNFLGGRSEIPIMLIMGLGLFIVGAMLFRRGLFLPEGRRLRLWVATIGFGLGIPLDLLMRLILTDVGQMAARYGTSTLVAFGVLSLVASWYAGGRTPGPVGIGLSWVGRMAMTCYVLQNLICAVIFYDWGFGLAEAMPARWALWGTLGVYAGVSAVLILGSGLWLRLFPRGPFEALMHHGHDVLVDRVHRPLAARRTARRAARRNTPAEDQDPQSDPVSPRTPSER
ncbi:DUF418 domain-containing protein [Nesterenkonia marinintestina]|uniref:DUF418 domain-containing protein n=1 Tax=Nesterenkonia marinintestina TaxID=2979865 RepID=UPI0021BE781A|nr:DUF418 domain-containing protein [Nesterenkonia sp. GX14115]